MQLLNVILKERKQEKELAKASKKPLTTWDCSCGEKNISSKFCPECGSPRPAETWNCLCGEKNIKSKFCPNCGNKR